MRLLLLLTIGLFCLGNIQAQTTLVYSEDFEQGAGDFILNTGSVGDSIGPNRWIINNDYTGDAVYPNTTGQDNTVGGSINFGPFSNYLHIHDSQAFAGNSAVGNSNYNPAVASDNFTETNNFCTLGLDSVRLAFYYNCEGAADAYGELWYQADNGPWTQVPNIQLSNSPQWNYVVVYNAGFNNKNDLRFGFRWVNSATANVPSVSLGIDGIRLVGVYSPELYDVRLEIDTIIPTQVCKGDGVLMFLNNPVPLCGLGYYEVQLSNIFGDFDLPTSLGIFQLNNENPSPALFTLPVPTDINVSNCYRIRVVRVDIQPFIVSDTSVCIEIIDCPNTITTLMPAVVSNPLDTLCVGSVIDVPFYSEGVYLGNTYIAQLSDSNGFFPANPNIIGTSNDDTEYPPGTMPRGNVSGLIAAQNQPIPPGCNYFIRVVSTSPAVTGTVYGPFCIRECDIESNNKQDVSFCITDVEGGDTTLTIEINQYDPPATYSLPNEFQVQLLDYQTFAVINTGVIGSVEATSDTTVQIVIPPIPQLFTIGINPGAYYMRVVATNSNQGWDILGTVIRLTVGAPNPSPLTIDIADPDFFFFPVGWDGDTTICQSEALYFVLSPYNSQSSYVWGLNDDPNFAEGGPYTGILFNGTGNNSLYVVETNFGCVGPGSSPAEITVLGPPPTSITGPSQVCLGDTANYQVSLTPSTYYEWQISDGTLVDTLSNLAQFVFTQAGNITIEISAVNQCGNADNTRNIIVRNPPVVDIGNDTTLCDEALLSFIATDGPNYNQYWSIAGEQVGTGPDYSLITDSTVTLTVRVTNYGTLACEAFDSLTVLIEASDPGRLDTVTLCQGQTQQFAADTTADAYLWSTGDITPSITAADSGWYVLTLYFEGAVCTRVDSFLLDLQVCYKPLELTNAFSPNGDGTNDTWIAKQTFDYEEFSMIIYNRWGRKMYETNDPFFAWDGTTDTGEEASDGTYFYVARLKHFENSGEFKGTVTLLR
jgi:gliding motility-associated-like protein